MGVSRPLPSPHFSLIVLITRACIAITNCWPMWTMNRRMKKPRVVLPHPVANQWTEVKQHRHMHAAPSRLYSSRQREKKMFRTTKHSSFNVIIKPDPTKKFFFNNVSSGRNAQVSIRRNRVHPAATWRLPRAPTPTHAQGVTYATSLAEQSRHANQQKFNFLFL